MVKSENWVVLFFGSKFPKEKKIYIDKEIPKINSRTKNKLFMEYLQLDQLIN